MPISQATTKLMVDDVQRTVSFYLEALGFTFARGVTEGTRERVTDWPVATPLAFAEVQSGQARLQFQSRGTLSAEAPRLAEAKIGGSMTIVFTCNNLDDFYTRVSEKTPFIKAPHKTFYGARECSLTDCNGYVLTFCDGGCA